MKQTLLALVAMAFIFLCINGGMAQQSWPVSVSYMAAYGNQIGGKVGTSYTWKEYSLEKENKANKIRRINFKPQFAVFARPQRNVNYLLHVESEYQLAKEGKRFYNSFSLGLGVLFNSEVLGGSVNLGSGEIEKDRELRTYFLPTVNYELGLAPKKVGYFFRMSLGQNISTHDDAAFFGAELGISIPLMNRKTDEEE